jgi:hypothetical protein
MYRIGTATKKFCSRDYLTGAAQEPGRRQAQVRTTSDQHRREMNHAIRTLRSTMHGFAMLEASRGFQWDADPDESFEWMIGFIDRGLRPAEN